jgi:proteasome accessory factor C
MPRRRASVKVEERLARMLVVVPYLIRHPGTTLAQASDLFAVPVTALRRDLELLFMAGLPPYGPGDLIDVEIDEDGAVWISMADHFSRPVRLTRQEALAVYIRATELAATPGLPQAPALDAALSKLRGALGPDALGDAAAIDAVRTGEPPEHLGAVRDAADRRERVAIAYAAASTGVHTERSIEPEAVFASSGRWYVAAWDVDADDERLLRVDRILTVRPTGERFELRGLEGAGRPLYSPGGQDVDVRLRLSPAARWVAEYYVSTDVVEEADGSVVATLPTKQIAWLARLLLRLGSDAAVIEPPEIILEVRRQAAAALAQYEPSPSIEPLKPPGGVADASG